MPSLKEIRNRITSVGSTMQITSAMKMVSAAKLKRAQDAVTQMRPYSEKLGEILSNLTATLDLTENVYSEDRGDSSVLIIAISSNKGLCGGFNNNIIKRVNSLIANEYAGKNVQVAAFGKKVNDGFKRSACYFNTSFLNIDDIFADLSFTNVSTVAQYAMDAFKDKKFDKVVVVYNSFVNAATQSVKAEQLLPIVATQIEGDKAVGDYIFEPGKQEIVEELIPKTIKIKLFKAFLDSNASEHGARMTAMHQATDNAKELQKSLKLSYNKARQASITNEILEIVGGAEALNS